MTRKRAEKLGEATINGKAVSFFTPPHDEPDLLWVDVLQLLRAFMSKSDAKEIAAKTRRFKDGQPVAIAVKSGASIVDIVPHGVAQTLCSGIDNLQGITEGGPAYNAYCHAAGDFMRVNWPQSVEFMLAAVMNTGGPVVRVHRLDGTLH